MQSPMLTTVKNFADFFEVPIEFFTDEYNDNTSFIVQNENTGIINNGSGSFNHCFNNDYETLTKQEKELITIYRNCSAKQQLQLMKYAYKIENKN